jgi:hypothetical protein
VVTAGETRQNPNTAMAPAAVYSYQLDACPSFTLICRCPTSPSPSFHFPGGRTIDDIRQLLAKHLFHCKPDLFSLVPLQDQPLNGNRSQAIPGASAGLLFASDALFTVECRVSIPD